MSFGAGGALRDGGFGNGIQGEDAIGVRDRQRLETRRRLYAAALEVFRRDGVREARIEDIAKVAEVSRGTFYFHFPTKDDVLAEFLIVAEDRFAAAVDALPAAAPVDSVVAVTAQAMADSWGEDPDLMVEVGIVALRRTAASLATPDSATGIRASVERRFSAAAARGELTDAVPAQVLADFFLANLFSVAIGWSHDRSFPLDVALQGAAFLFLHGASVRP